MPHIRTNIIAEIDPTKPVQEICGVISAVLALHPGQEINVLNGIVEAANKWKQELKGAEAGAKPIRQPEPDSQNPG